MKYQIRDKSLITGNKHLEFLYEFKNFPVFIGCMSTPEQEAFVLKNYYLLINKK